MTDALTHVEQESLSEYEAVIESGLKTFAEVGTALFTIRDSRLYRSTHGTFEDYCRERWGMTRRHANRMIESAVVIENVGPIGPKPATESQARPLARLEPEEQRKAWKEANDRAEAEGRKVTAKDVELAVNSRTSWKEEISQEIIRTDDVRFGAIEKAKKATFILSSIGLSNSDRDEALRYVIDWCKKELKRGK